MRAAVYSGTRNVYEQMMTAAKSLLIYSNVEEIYFLIEDDTFPYDLPKEVKCINVANQTFFPKNGPNYINVCTYMVLLRAAYTKIFPKLDKILTIDMDTVVNENISYLWDIDLTDYYIAAVKEDILSAREGTYFNMGVAMLNLKKIREDKKDDEMIDALNTYWYRYKEQDCFNEFLKEKTLLLPTDYNVSNQIYSPKHEIITHFASIPNVERFACFKYYNKVSIQDLPRDVQENITLDIIIPTYNNKKGLRRTLNSIENNPYINIIVVDDGSNISYDDILTEYPHIKFYSLEQNSGPGVAKQYGLNHATGTYITFLDTGDYFYNDGLQTVMQCITENTYIKLYTFSYVYDDSYTLADRPDDKTIGHVYKRTFIQWHNIHFSKEGSYANEDYGFNRACKIILDEYERLGFPKAIKHIYMPTFYEHIDKNSLTKKDNNLFFYKSLAPGIIINGLHAINIASKWGVDIPYLIGEYNYIMAQEYFFFLTTLYERPELVDDVWIIIRDFYLNHYKIYEKFALRELPIYFSQVTLPKIHSRMKHWDNFKRPNIMRFIQELRNNEFTPIRYLTLN